ncbi:GIY-YIG nuclease family protein [Anaerostipes butyraticus]|uniref:GIY-YIG domain-containing protein n=1 Tax=Anaerostipes butyraticus TaxID=645466 RepID=A0A916Q9N0_9FIRM|nr:GIY-YIG nuclease family protein [Anaerostipes butyraticus]GFO86822.1 GIY-YIG domain-containing protein [Anaerostipes butyraticus]HJC81697.1 GIY-YIG nuclease family protein [Candidatus Anaerostipes avicola]
MKNYTYMLECGDGTLYTGWTNDLEKRVKRHNEGKGAKYTRSRLPVKLVYQEHFDTKREAMKREAQIKKMTRKKKLLLIRSYQQKLKCMKMKDE